MEEMMSYLATNTNLTTYIFLLHLYSLSLIYTWKLHSTGVDNPFEIIIIKLVNPLTI